MLRVPVSITPIVLSRSFSVEILIGVELYYGRPSQIGVSLSWKMEHPDDCITVMRHVASKVAATEDRLYLLTRNVPWRCVFQMSGLGI